MPAPSPRGTVRDSFPSHGSSSTKASINQALTRELGILPERSSRYTSAAVLHVFRQCWRRTRPVLQRSFAFPHTNGSTNFFATCHQSDVGPLSCQVTSKPVSAPLQRGIRFFQYPTPVAPWADLAACGLPKESDTGFPRSVPRSNIGLGARSRPRCMWVTRHPIRKDVSRIHYLLLKRDAAATFACHYSRSLSQVQVISPYRLASTHPACGCQEGLLLAFDTPRPSALRYIVRVALDSDP